MKMNAKKLLVVLLALLLALACVFVACGKKNDTTDTGTGDKQSEGDKSGDKKEEPTPTVSKQELQEIADDFKAKFEAEYLHLYTDKVKNELGGYEAEAILKITAATSRQEALDLVDEFMGILRDYNENHTLVNEVDAIIERIAEDSIEYGEDATAVDGVSLVKDADDVALLVHYDELLRKAMIAPTIEAQKTLLDKYEEADTSTLVAAIAKRFANLQKAKEAAREINPEVKKELDRIIAADMYTESDMVYDNNPSALTFKDYEKLLALQATVDTFARVHELAKDIQLDEEGHAVDVYSDAYEDILGEAARMLIEANEAFIATTGVDINYKAIVEVPDESGVRQLIRARNLINATYELIAAAKAAAIPDTYNENSFRYLAETTLDKVSSFSYYWILTTTLAAGQDTADGLVKPVKVTSLDDDATAGISKWVSKNDLYNNLDDATTALDVRDYELTRVFISSDAAGEDEYTVSFPFNVEYKLDLTMQEKAEQAAKVAREWIRLINDPGIQHLDESFITGFYTNIIFPILNNYNDSLATALNAYAVFADQLVVMNYVDNYPVKDDTFNEYVFTTASENWRNALKAAISDVIFQSRANGDAAYKHYLAQVFEELYKDGKYDFDAFADANLTSLNLHTNEDGSVSPSLFYRVFTYYWMIDNLGKTEKEVVTDARTDEEGNTDVIQTVLDDVKDYFFSVQRLDNPDIEGFYELSLELNKWVAKYITISETYFDLEPFMTVQNDKVCTETDPVAFGAVKFTFANDKLEEVADEVINKIGKNDVDATPSEALDVTSFADYAIAQKAIAKYNEELQAMKDALVTLKDTYRALFNPGDPDAIAKALELCDTTKRAYSEELIHKHAEELESTPGALIGFDLSTFNYNTAFRNNIVLAKEIQDEVLELYPHGEWDEALSELKAALKKAQDDVAKMNTYIKAYDDILAAANKKLDYYRLGNKVGTADDKLIDDDTLNRQVELVDVLNIWKNILTDVANFKNVNETGWKVDQDKAYLINPDWYTSTDLLGRKLQNYLYEDGEDGSDSSPAYSETGISGDLLNYMRAILNGEQPDQKALNVALADATTEYETARDAFAADFKLVPSTSYYTDDAGNNVDKMTNLIHRIDALAGAYDYLNLSVTNDYTGNAIDLFSQLFNERILANYLRSARLTFVYLANEYPDAGIDPDALMVNEQVVEYIRNNIDTYDSSSKTFTSVVAGRGAAKAAWRTPSASLEWFIKKALGIPGDEPLPDTFDFDLFCEYLQDHIPY